jgi:hypothetical protein
MFIPAPYVIDHVVRNKLWQITSIVGAVLCFLVLSVIGIVAIHPRSRSKLDRVSFRIVVYALAAKYARLLIPPMEVFTDPC